VASSHFNGTLLAQLFPSSGQHISKRIVALNLMKEKNIPLEKQEFDWREIVRVTTSKTG
jgi:hypothetical protein